MLTGQVGAEVASTVADQWGLGVSAKKKRKTKRKRADTAARGSCRRRPRCGGATVRRGDWVCGVGDAVRARLARRREEGGGRRGRARLARPWRTAGGLPHGGEATEEEEGRGDV